MLQTLCTFVLLKENSKNEQLNNLVTPYALLPERNLLLRRLSNNTIQLIKISSYIINDNFLRVHKERTEIYTNKDEKEEEKRKKEEEENILVHTNFPTEEKRMLQSY